MEDALAMMGTEVFSFGFSESHPLSESSPCISHSKMLPLDQPTRASQTTRLECVRHSRRPKSERLDPVSLLHFFPKSSLWVIFNISNSLKENLPLLKITLWRGVETLTFITWLVSFFFFFSYWREFYHLGAVTPDVLCWWQVLNSNIDAIGSKR